jgi:hypothetical protein
LTDSSPMDVPKEEPPFNGENADRLPPLDWVELEVECTGDCVAGWKGVDALKVVTELGSIQELKVDGGAVEEGMMAG